MFHSSLYIYLSAVAVSPSDITESYNGEFFHSFSFPKRSYCFLHCNKFKLRINYFFSHVIFTRDIMKIVRKGRTFSLKYHTNTEKERASN